MGRWLKHVPAVEGRAAMGSVGVAVALLVVKFVAYYLTGSAAIFSDAMESIVNVIASGVALYALSVAHRPADEEHPYGHGKVEFLSAAFEGGMVLLAAIVIVWNTVSMIVRGEIGPAQLGVGMWLMGVAMVVNGGVGLFLMGLGRGRKSALLEADGVHLVSDAVTSAAALGALAVVHWTGWKYADPVAALLVAGYIGWMAFGLVKGSAAGLMDEQDVADERLLKEILDRHVGDGGVEPRICSYHKLRHRHSGRYHWVDFHIMVPAGLDVRRGHEIASAIEWEIEQALGEGNATAHVEPCKGEGCGGCEKKLM